MLYRSIAQYNHLFPIGLGAMPLSLVGRPNEHEAIDIILDFLNAGGNFIDTADVYGLDDKDQGHNEKLIAKALKQAKSTTFLLATKGGARRPNGGFALGAGHPKQLRIACEQSLKNLEIETHQLYYFHGPDPQIPLADSFGELIKLKEEGKIEHIGIANIDLLELKIAMQLTTIAAVQNRCNLFCKEDFDNGLIQFCYSQGIAYIPYCPLGGWLNHAQLMEYPLIKKIAEKYQITAHVLSLAWLLQKGKHLLPIPGMDKKEHFTMNKKAVDFLIAPEDLITLDTLPNLYAAKHVD